MSSARESLEAALRNPEYVDVSDLPNVIVDLRYSSTQNLLNRDVYQGFQRALLHRIAAEKFQEASYLLSKERPDLRFMIFDALRPESAQEEFWRLVQGTPQQPFFADPAKGSIHSYGFALDISLCNAQARELDMGTGFDDLTELAGPENEARFLASGALTEAQVHNRRLLRSVMTRAGFLQLPHEWWHYDALPGQEVRARFGRCK